MVIPTWTVPLFNNMFVVALRSTLLFFLFSICQSSIAQDTLFYWPTSCLDNVHSRIVESYNGDENIFLLSRSSDFDFRHPVAELHSLSLSTLLLKSTCIQSDSLHTLAGMSLGREYLRIYGTAQNDGRLSPYTAEVDIIDLQSKGSKSEFVTSPQLINDICNTKKNCFLGQSNFQTSGVFNIEITWLNRKKGFEESRSIVLKSPYNEQLDELKVDAKGRIAILAKRYKNLDYSEYSSVIYLIDKNGNQLWVKELSDKMAFDTHCISFQDNGNIVHGAGKKQSELALSFSIASTLDLEGNLKNSVKLKDFLVNGFSTAKGSLYAFGSTTKWVAPFIIQKAKFLQLTEDLLIGKSISLDQSNAPDNKMPLEMQNKLPSSSEYLGADILNDGRLLLYGRVFFNSASNLEEALNRTRSNQNLVAIYRI